ncbi:MAG: GNAT family N-acetyltransferase [Gammaproteobacteria bacterium]
MIKLEAMEFEQITLEGDFVRLEPLEPHHKDGLCEAVKDGELWKLFVTLVPNTNEIDDFIHKAMAAHKNHDGITFATVDRKTNQVIGSTRFMRANLPYRKVEIGYTFIAKTFQRTRINTEAKLLMLTYAFENLELNRVEFLTDFLNLKSRNAILRLGAKEEGILRNHMVMPNGRIRDSVIFSIIKNEWPGAKQNLLHKLAQ